MAKVKINTNDEPIRLFNSDFLEFFTHISPIAILVIWLPVMGFCVYRSVVMNSNSFFVLTVGIVLGLKSWTLAEYLLHRFLFHFPVKQQGKSAFHSCFMGFVMSS